jgi:membrane protein implicated in regulation of membrane protease activity
VTQVNGNPIFWLLEWAGVKERSRSLDRWLLWGSGLIVVAVMLPLMLLVELSGRAMALQWAMLIIAFLALVSLLQLASRRIVKRQLTRTIDSR